MMPVAKGRNRREMVLNIEKDLLCSDLSLVILSLKLVFNL